jgi:hypothetical protein
MCANNACVYGTSPVPQLLAAQEDALAAEAAQLSAGQV